MCDICTKEAPLQNFFGYDVCSYCHTRIAHILPQEKKVQRVLEAHAQSYILTDENETDTPIYTKRLKVLSTYAPHTKTILDFGCGNGNFVKFLRSKDYKAYGFDKSRDVTHHLTAFGIPTYLRVHDIPDSYFDVITCFDVIEHTTTPQMMLNILAKKMKKRGILIITTPNVQGVSSVVLGKRWWVLGPTAHFVLFSTFSLQLLLSRVGWKILEVTTDTITPWFLPTTSILPRILNKCIYLCLFSFKEILFRRHLGDNIQLIAKRE